MGLAPYGNPQSEKVEIYRKKITSDMIVIHEDGSVELNQKYFNYMSGLTMTSDKVWEQAFGFPRKKDEEEIMQYHCDLALAIQKVTDEIVTKMVAYALRITQSKNVCLAGGVALNCVSNSHMSKTLGIDTVWIQPAAGDAGGALGAALAVQYMYSDVERKVESTDSMQGSYLGPDFEQFDIDMVVKKYKAKKISFDTDDMLCREVAGLIAEGNVVGWVQGRMEWGPRALGNRSILANPMDPSIQKRLNLKIKCREGFRPFAPAILAEEVSHYFETKQSSPYMLFVHDVVKTLRSELPEDYHTWSWQDRLYFERSSLPAVTHLDYSARLQTVHKETNPLFHKLITEFKNKTQCPVIVNTSFNVRGEPIVSTPDDSYRCFMTTDMDYVVIGRNIFFKKDQPAYTGKSAFAKD
jgi:carbamoyltransferase